MRLIKGQDQLPFPPRACAVTNRDRGDFIDLQVVIDRPEPTRLYLLTEVVEEAAGLLGMVPAKKVEELEADLKAMSKKLAETQDTMTLAAELEEQIGRERIPA
jgi:hypothetical protein